jgi:hypothetical protein
MDHRRAEEIQVLLEGIALPATRAELAAYAGREDSQAVTELERLPDRSYASINEVGEELVPTQPRPPAVEPAPRPESGQPPGGDEYTNPHPESGAQREGAPPGYPPQKQIDAQTETVKKQQQAREG